MNTSIKQELAQHIIDLLNDGVITDDNLEDTHFHAFNADYYIIGYFQAEQWLEEHDISAYEAIQEVVDYENGNFGEVNIDINAESVVNTYVYVQGEKLLSVLNYETVEELKDELTEIVGG